MRAWQASYASPHVLMQIENADDLVSPVLIAALDGWVDAGSAATRAPLVAANGTRVATFDDIGVRLSGAPPHPGDRDGRPATLTGPSWWFVAAGSVSGTSWCSPARSRTSTGAS